MNEIVFLSETALHLTPERGGCSFKCIESFRLCRMASMFTGWLHRVGRRTDRQRKRTTPFPLQRQVAPDTQEEIRTARRTSNIRV